MEAGIGIVISQEEMEAFLAALPDARIGGAIRHTTKEQDEKIVAVYAHNKNKSAAAKAIGISEKILRRRAKELMDEGRIKRSDE